MSDKYLWNRSGDPDPHVTRLEGLLGPLRYRPGALDYTRLPASIPSGGMIWRWKRSLLTAAACAAVVLVAAGLWWRSPRPVPPAAPPPGPWLVQSLTGIPTVAGTPLRGERRIEAGRWIETDTSSSVRLSADSVGMIDLGPGTRLRIVRSSEGDYRLTLTRKTLHAHI